MAFTDNCDLFASISEAGVNLVAKHVMAQRPSLFNYATIYIISHQDLACRPVPYTVDVHNHANPLFTAVPALPLFGSDAPPMGLNFCVQVVDAEVDFFPGNVLALPAPLNPPLQPQHAAIKIRVCGGLDCPANETLDGIVPLSPQGRDKQQAPPEVVPSTKRLQCFCIDAVGVGHVAVENVFGKLSLVGKVDGIDIVGLEPPGLAANIECYLRSTLAILLKEKFPIPVSTMLFDISLLSAANVSATLTPNPPIPNNPAIEGDQLKIFMNLQIS